MNISIFSLKAKKKKKVQHFITTQPSDPCKEQDGPHIKHQFPSKGIGSGDD
jgi:hypothetical protein